MDIFKIQRPLAGDMSSLLVYNEDRSIEFQTPVDGSLMELFEGGDYKVYVEAEATPEGSFTVKGRVGDRDW